MIFLSLKDAYLGDSCQCVLSNTKIFFPVQIELGIWKGKKRPRLESLMLASRRQVEVSFSDICIIQRKLNTAKNRTHTQQLLLIPSATRTTFLSRSESCFQSSFSVNYFYNSSLTQLVALTLEGLFLLNPILYSNWLSRL